MEIICVGLVIYRYIRFVCLFLVLGTKLRASHTPWRCRSAALHSSVALLFCWPGISRSTERFPDAGLEPKELYSPSDTLVIPAFALAQASHLGLPWPAEAKPSLAPDESLGGLLQRAGAISSPSSCHSYSPQHLVLGSEFPLNVNVYVKGNDNLILASALQIKKVSRWFWWRSFWGVWVYLTKELSLSSDTPKRVPGI